MPQKTEKVSINPREVFRSMEQWKNWFFTILLLLILSVAGSQVVASDAESMYNDDQAIVLTVENAAAFYATIESFGGDVNQTVENEDFVAPEVNIRTGVNVRSLDSSAATISSFPRGNAEVVGWFAGTSGDSFGRIARGVWLVVENDGQEGAVFSGLVFEPNGSALTDDELAAAGVPQYTLVNGVPTFTPPEAEGDEAGSGDGDDGDDDEVGDGGDDQREPESTATPEQLVVPEVPSSFQVTINVFENGTIVQREVTVTPNPEEIMALPFGMVDFDRHPQFRTFAELIESNMSGGSRTVMEPLRSLGIHAVYVGRTGDATTGYAHHFAIERADGTWVSFISGGGQGNMAVLPVSRELIPTASNASTNITFVSEPTRMGNNRLDITANPVMPGDSAIIFVYSSRNTETGAEDQGPYAQGQRGSCGGRNTDEIIDYITSDSDNVCTLASGIELDGAAFTLTGIAALDD